MKDITYNLDEIIEIIKKNTDKNYCVTLKDTNFEFGHLLSLQKRLNENPKILDGFSIQINENLSMRRALIALLQEKYYTYNTNSVLNV